MPEACRQRHSESLCALPVGAGLVFVGGLCRCIIFQDIGFVLFILATPFLFYFCLFVFVLILSKQIYGFISHD